MPVVNVQVPITSSPKPPQKVSWFIRGWRPAMAWQYGIVCMFDFMIAPTLWNFGQYLLGIPLTQWHPITLEGAGMYHMAMAPIVGIYTVQRTKEKIQLWKNGVDPKTDPENHG